MLKLAALTLFPVLVATLYTQQEESQPSPSLTVPTEMEQQDRAFLSVLSRDEGSVHNSERADRAFLTNLEVEDRLAARASRQEMPVLRAIPIERPAIPVARVEPPVASAGAPDSAPEIRRAIPIAPESATPTTTISTNLRNTLRQPFVTMIESEPEVRTASATGQRRASITIYGDQVVIRSSGTSLR